jgi:hypothetical protein
MPKRKHTRCSHCGWTRKCRYRETMSRDDFSGPWLYVARWSCVACLVSLDAFIGEGELVQLVMHELEVVAD